VHDFQAIGSPPLCPSRATGAHQALFGTQCDGTVIVSVGGVWLGVVVPKPGTVPSERYSLLHADSATERDIITR
jgi:hypothetical protein